MQIKRKLYNLVKAHLNSEEITLIIGPRQAGKTTLAKQLQHELNIEGESTYFFNLDIETDFRIFESQESFLFALKNIVGIKKSYIFIDEFQRKQNGGKFIKGIYDMKLPYKFIITGSGSIELKEQIHESLAGRKKTFEINTLSFEEYFNYETNYEFENNLENIGEIYYERIHQYLLNYITFGGYPKVVTTETFEEKLSIIQEIYNSYLIKDITSLLNIEKTTEFKKLVENLAVMDSKLINISQMATNIGLAPVTLEKYLWYLEKTYIISPLRPYSKNPLKEINKAYTYYFNDIGLRNLITNEFLNPSTRTNFGLVFQNYIFIELQRYLIDKVPFSLNFWRTKDNAEVDLIMRKGKKIIPIECKFTEYNSSKITRSLYSFINKYKPEIAFVVNKNYTNELMVENTKVIHIPFYKLKYTLEHL